MKDGFAHFDRRLEQLEEKKAALDEGHRLSVDDTGLMKLIPTGARRRQIGRMIPLRAMMIMAVVVLCFKGFLLYRLGFGVYTAKVAGMAQGDTMDRVGAYLMQVDPVTLWIYEVLHFLLG
ncbi:hypothetical protein [Pseudooceanicola onchidii]|uniref:hypothetical protein n=1 Tax=Pseudooceanicola onchidii TaxID=2562279 RepID=UPI0010AB1B40|nr:hypothetical protein [Pseudooceanicola onchidii]